MAVPSKPILILELLLLFILYPLFLSLNFISTPIKITSIPIILLYLAYISYHHKTVIWNHRKHLKPKKFWRNTFLKLGVIAISSGIYIKLTAPLLLFKPVVSRPATWLKFILIYSFISVIPQEFIYRTVYFNRYNSLFKNNLLLITSNALLFCIAHILFKSVLILGITFIGGLLFARTYKKTNSILWVSIEHAIYGSWLFTVGMGKMLGFPI